MESAPLILEQGVNKAAFSLTPDPLANLAAIVVTMKKSEALHILGLSEGASADDIKRAHRSKVRENHPDRFASDPEEQKRAEERTKKINQARDVLSSGRWDPEFGPSAPYGGYSGQNPFEGFGGFGPRGSYTYVWTQGQGGFTVNGQPVEDFFSGFAGSGQAGGPSGYSGFSDANGYDAEAPNNSPFGSNPFTGSGFEPGFGQSPFASSIFDLLRGMYSQPESAEARLERLQKSFKQRITFVGIKLAILFVLGTLGFLAAGIFLYVLGSLSSYLRHERGLSRVFIAMMGIVVGPWILALMPKGYSPLSFGLLIFFVAAFIFDARSLYTQGKLVAQESMSIKQPTNPILLALCKLMTCAKCNKKN